MRARHAVRRSVVLIVAAVVALIVLLSLLLLMRHSRAGSFFSAAHSISRFERDLSRYDERWGNGRDLLPGDRPALLRHLEELCERASSVWQQLSVLKRARVLHGVGLLGDSDFYLLTREARRQFPWSSELAAVGAQASSAVGRHREALSLLSLLDPDHYQALMLSVYLALPLEDRIAAWHGLLSSSGEDAFSHHNPVAISRMMARFCERNGYPEWQLDWTINAACFALLEGQYNEVMGLLRSLLHDAALPEIRHVRRIVELFHLSAAPGEALSLCERSPLRHDVLLYAELLWAAGNREAAIALWDSDFFSGHGLALFNRVRQAPRPGDRALVDRVLEGEEINAYHADVWVSLRILASRLREEKAGDLREVAGTARLRHDAEAAVRLELEALTLMDQGMEQAGIAAGYWTLVNAHGDMELVWARAAWWMARYRMWDELARLMRHEREQGLAYASLNLYRALERSLAGDHEAAFESLERSASGTQAWRAMANRALLHEAERSYRTALEDLLLATRLYPGTPLTGNVQLQDYAGLLLRISALQEQLGSPGEALRTLQRAQDLDPSSLIIRQALDRAQKQKERSTRSAPIRD